MRSLCAPISQMTWTFFLTFGLLLSPQALQAQSLKLRMGGRLESNLFVGLVPPTGSQTLEQSNLGRYFDYRNSNSLFLELRPKFGAKLAGKAQIQIRNINFSRATNGTDLELYERQFPVHVRLYELYIDFNELLPFLDLRVGQQRIAWGTATAFNPTDNINPYNLENPLDFTERLPIPAIKASAYIGESLTLTLVGIPFFVPSIIPFTLFKNVVAVDVPVQPPKGWELASFESFTRPAYRVENAQLAAKLAGEFGSINGSLSYFYGNLKFPAQNNVEVKTKIEDIAKKRAAVDVNLIYPRAHIIGMDLSSSLGGVGVWLEAALTIPTEQVDLLVTQGGKRMEKNPLTGKEIPIIPVIESTPYVKVTAGIDYTFEGGWYINAQYLYGFFNQQTVQELHHFVFLTLRQSFLRDKLLVQLTAGGELDATPNSGPAQDGNQVGLGILVNPEVHFRPVDSAQITLGGIWSRGHRGTTLALFQDLAQVYFRASMSF